MNLVDFSTRRPVTVTMIWVGAVLFGFASYGKLPLNLLPEITYPTLTVRTELPGTAPAEVEHLIAKPIEEAVGVVSGVVRVSSVSRPGVADVSVEFEWGTDMDIAALRVREKLDFLKLPRDVEAPLLLRFDPSLDPVMRIGVHGTDDLVALRLFAEERFKKRELEGLDGVAAIKVSGGLEEEIHVEVHEGRLASLDIPIAQVARRLEQENVNLSGGTLKDGEAEYLVRTLSEFVTPEEIADVQIAAPGGVPVHLRDVGRAWSSHKERKIITRLEGTESVEVAIYKKADANTIEVARRVHEKLDEVRARPGALPVGVRMDVVFDQSRFIRESIRAVRDAAVWGGLLAILVLYLFLRSARSTVVVSLAIPLSVVATFALLFQAGVSLNIMSLGGLALGVGMLVDSSIVVLENIERYSTRGHAPREAARLGTSEVATAVTAATLTTVCVFLPIVFVEGIAGQIFTDQALAVTFSLLASLLCALTLIPMLSALQLDTADGAREIGGPTYLAGRGLRGLGVGIGWLARGIGLVGWPIGRGFDLCYGALAQAYEPSLRWALRHRAVVLIVAGALFAASVGSLRFLGTELIPEMSQGDLLVNVTLPPGTPLEETSTVLAEMENKASQDPSVRSVYAIVGSKGQAGGTAEEEKEHIGQLHIRLRGDPDREREEAVFARLRSQFEDLPSVEHKFARPALFSFRTPIEVEVRGHDLDLLRTVARDVAARMETIEGLEDVKSSAEGGNPELQIRFDRARVAALGMDVGTIAGVVRHKVLGEVPTELRRQDRKVDIRVRAREADRRSLPSIERLAIDRAGEVPVPLRAVARIAPGLGPSEIRRVDQERVAVITANLVGRDLGSVAAEIRERLEALWRESTGQLPAGFRFEVGGQTQEMAVSFQSLFWAMLLAVFLVYFVMASQFESLLSPLVILFSMPLALVGVVGALLLTDQTVSVVVLIGIVMLAGIVVNNAIVLVDFMGRLHAQGLEVGEAIVSACRVRLRPILMTTMTTMLGLAPMAIGVGEGAEVRAPLAITVIGGLLASTLLTLIVVPTVASIAMRAAPRGANTRTPS